MSADVEPRGSRAFTVGLQLAGLLAVAVCAWRCQGEIWALAAIPPYMLLLPVSLITVDVLARSFELRFGCGVLGVRMSVVEAAGVVASCALLSFLPLAAGNIAMAAVLRQRYSLGCARYAALVIGQTLLTGLVAGVIGVLLVNARPGLGRDVVAVLTVGFVALGVGPVCLLCAPARWSKGAHFVARVIRSLLEGWGTLRAHPGAISSLLIFQLFKLLILGARYAACLLVLGFDGGLYFGLLAAVASHFILIVSWMPGNIGARALIVGVLGSFVGLGSQTFLAAGLDLLVAALVVIILGIPALFLLSRDGAERASATE